MERNSSSNVSAYLLELPVDVLQRHVFAMLPPDDVQNTFAVCHAFGKLAPSVWKLRLEELIEGSVGDALDRTTAQWKRSYRREYYMRKTLPEKSLKCHDDGCAVTLGARINNETILTKCNKGCMRLWNVFSGECLRRFHGQLADVTAIKRLDDGKVISGSEKGRVRVWDVFSGSSIWDVCFDREYPIFSLARLTKNEFVSSGVGGTVRLWDLEKRRCTGTFIHGESLASRRTVVFELDENTFATYVISSSLKVWDATTGSCVQCTQSFGLRNGVINFVSKVDRDTIVTMHSNGTARLWNLPSGGLVRDICFGLLRLHAAAQITGGLFLLIGAREDPFSSNSFIYDSKTGKVIQFLANNFESSTTIEVMNEATFVPMFQASVKAYRLPSHSVF